MAVQKDTIFILFSSDFDVMPQKHKKNKKKIKLCFIDKRVKVLVEEKSIKFKVDVDLREWEIVVQALIRQSFMSITVSGHHNTKTIDNVTKIVKTSESVQEREKDLDERMKNELENCNARQWMKI